MDKVLDFITDVQLEFGLDLVLDLGLDFGLEFGLDLMLHLVLDSRVLSIEVVRTYSILCLYNSNCLWGIEPVTTHS